MLLVHYRVPAESNNTLYIVVFSVHEISSTSTPEYVTSTLQSSSKWNCHSPSPTDDQSNSLPPSTSSMQSSSKNPSTIRNWHTPFPANNPHNASKKCKKLTKGLLFHSHVPPKREDEVLVQIVKIQLSSIGKDVHQVLCVNFLISNTKYWINVRIISKVICVRPHEYKICKRSYLRRKIWNEHYSSHIGGKKNWISVKHVIIHITT